MNAALTKARLLYDRAQRQQDEAYCAARLARSEAEKAWSVYLRLAREAGLCAVCGSALADCKCVAMAVNSEAQS